MSTDATTMGKRIAQLRKDKGMTQEQLAEKLGVSAQAVSKWENDISCPDIALLPLLAGTLGVTTDELLGIEPIEPHVVVVNSDKDRKKNWSMDVELGAKHNGIVFGCMLLLLGIIYLIAQIDGVPITTEGNLWWIVLSLLILGTGIGSFRKRFSFIGLGLILFSGYLFYVKTINTSASIAFNYIWPAAVVLIALGIIFPIATKRKNYIYHGKHGEGKTPRVSYKEVEGYVNMDCAFCDEKRAFAEGEFKGADIDISFGSFEMDLTASTSFANNCIIKIDASFGSLTLIVPPSVNVVKSMNNSFASCSIHGKSNPDATQTLFVKGNISFGSVDIKIR